MRHPRPQGTRRARAALAMFGCFGSLVLLLAAPAQSQERDDRARVLEVRAERLAAAGRCEEVLGLLAAARDGSLLRLRGNCEIELERYADAIATLNLARRAMPDLTDLDLLRGIAYYHAGDLESAARALETARDHTANTARLELYTGLVLLRRSQPREAALALERARRADPDAVEPAASYYAALAWQAEQDRERARAALSRVIGLDPDGPWATQAEQALRRDDGPGWSARLMAGIEYDDNVVLRARDAPSTPGDSDENDFRGVWGLDGSLRLFATDRWAAGLVGSYSGSAHFDLDTFDTHYPSVGAFIDRRLSEQTVVRLRYDFAYAWVDYDPFLLTHNGTLSLIQDWETAGISELFIGNEYSDYRFALADVPDGSGPAGSDCLPPSLRVCGPAGLLEHRYRDRDGAGLSTGFEHRVRIGEGSSLRGGYTYERYWAQGQEWDYDQHRVHAGYAVGLPWELLLDVDGSYTFEPHRNPTSFPDPDVAFAAAITSPNAIVPAVSGKDRRDHLFAAGAALEKFLNDRTSVSVGYRYLHANSTSGAFDYDRHTVGAYLTLHLP